MTPLETELLQLFLPAIWSGLLGAAAWWQRSQSNRLDSICKTLGDFRDDIGRIEREMANDRMAARHHLDRLIGATNARFASIESGCAIHHGRMSRRSTDAPDPDNWAHDSDLGQMRMPPPAAK